MVELALHLDPGADTPLYEQLYGALAGTLYAVLAFIVFSAVAGTLYVSIALLSDIAIGAVSGLLSVMVLQMLK